MILSLARKLWHFKRRLKAKYYTWRVRCAVKVCGVELKVNGKSAVTRNTHLGDNVNFNGMVITGVVKLL